MKPAIALFAILVASVITGVILPFSSASATSEFDNPSMTESLHLSNSACSASDVSNNWFSLMESNYTGTEDLSDYINPDEYRWGVMQIHNITEDYIKFFAVDKDLSDGYTFGYDSDGQKGLSVLIDSAVGAWPSSDQFISISLRNDISCGYEVSKVNIPFVSANSTDTANGWRRSNVNSNDAYVFGYFSSQASIYFVFMDFVPPTGYAGEVPPQSPLTMVLPKFGYNVSNDVLSAIYLRNLDIAVGVNNGYNWTYYLYQTESDYDITGLDPIHSETLPLDHQFQYTLPADDYYVLKISLTVTPPAAPRPDILQVTFQIDYSTGTFTSGSTELNECNDSGVCIPSTVACSTGDIFQQMNCDVQRQLSLGVINPSLNAFKDLLTSLTVPSDPTCSISLTDISIIPGFVFPLSDFSDKACNSSEDIRTAYPVISAIMNFNLAFALFVMVVAIINRFLNKDKNDLIEGV